MEGNNRTHSTRSSPLPSFPASSTRDGISNEWPPLDSSHLPQKWASREYRQDFPSLTSYDWHRGNADVFFDEGVWESANPIIDEIRCLLLTDSCYGFNNYMAPNGLALVHAGQEGGEDAFRRVSDFFISDMGSSYGANKMARKAFEGIEQRTVKIL
jgi:hypothetical protein